ncbi:MAG: nitroreductase [Robiginitomaculum sp.]|nr:nitroreductase [Robiginitomaculum sp.]
MNFDQPDKCDRLKAADANEDVLKFLSQRRSALVRSMSAPGPDADALGLILRLAARAPDHRKLFPWRFILFDGDARTAFGAHLARLFKEDCPNVPQDRIEHERARFERAPLVIGVISSPKDCPRGTPVWEQELSAGAVCMNMLLAARASGFAAQWLTEWYAFDERIDTLLGLSDTERMAGFIYIGTATEDPTERPRPDVSNLTQYWRK